MNIGPDRNGRISDEIRKRMFQVGDWLRVYGESIYAASAGPYEPVDNVYGSTWHGNKVYLHILDVEAFRSCVLPYTENRIENVALFSGEKAGEKVEAAETPEGIRLVLPEGTGQDGEPDTIVVLTMEEEVRAGGDAEIYFTGKE